MLAQILRRKHADDPEIRKKAIAEKPEPTRINPTARGPRQTTPVNTPHRGKNASRLALA
jgi:hypothetical protein